MTWRSRGWWDEVALAGRADLVHRRSSSSLLWTLLLGAALGVAAGREPQLAVEAAKCGLIFCARHAGAGGERLAPLRAVLSSLPRAAVEEASAAIQAVESPTFWELTDRRVNFDYVAPEERERVRREAIASHGHPG